MALPSVTWLWREQEQGYIDEAGKLRKIPFEVMVRGDKVPVYSETLEDNGRFNEVPACHCLLGCSPD